MLGARAEGGERESSEASCGQDVQRVHQGQQGSSRHCADRCAKFQVCGGTGDGS